MSTVIAVPPRTKVRVRVLPGSARIQAILPRGAAVMYDPITRRWLRMERDRPCAVDPLGSLTPRQGRLLKAALQAFHRARLTAFRTGPAKANLGGAGDPRGRPAATL